MRFFLVTISFFMFKSGLAQEDSIFKAKVNNLKQQLSLAKHDTTRIRCLVEWDKLIYVSDPSLDYT